MLPVETSEMCGNTRFAAFLKMDYCLLCCSRFTIPGVKKLRACLLAQAELLDDILIAIGIVFLEVVEQAATLADHHEKSAARAVVLLVRFEVLRQLANPLA